MRIELSFFRSSLSRDKFETKSLSFPQSHLFRTIFSNWIIFFHLLCAICQNRETLVAAQNRKFNLHQFAQLARLDSSVCRMDEIPRKSEYGRDN